MTQHINFNWKAAAVILGLLAAGLCVRLYQINATLDDVFHYNVTISIKDKITGEDFDSLTVYYPARSSTALFEQSVSTSGGPDRYEFSGIAYEPRTFGFSAEGYQRKNVVITEDTKGFLTVELEPADPLAEQVIVH